MYAFLIGLPRPLKGTLVLLADLLAIVVAWFVALSLRLSDPLPIAWLQNSLSFLAFALAIGLVLSFALRIHAIKLGSFDWTAIIRIALWASLVSFIATVTNFFFWLGAPRTTPIIMGPILIFLSLMARIGAIWVLQLLDRLNADQKRVAIYGAGSGGIQMVAALNNSHLYRPVFFVDDDERLHGVVIAGLRVHSPEELQTLITKRRIETVFLAIPSISRTQKETIVKKVQQTGCDMLELPTYAELIESGGVLNSLRPVDPEALLGRDHVELNLPAIENTYTGESIMVSGAGGSIGSELCRQICAIKPARLVLFEHSELALYTLEKELRPLAEANNIDLDVVLGSVLDSDRIRKTIKENDISIILHAAAYKHVPLIESNEIAGARNNILGTKIMADAASDCGVKRFILISTDKAVRPTNIMGATKRLAELIIQGAHNSGSDTLFSLVRFGNVLGSSGSVIPLFKEQIANGGPVTLTDHEVTRYFMTIPEAARLVLLSGAFAEGGDVFLLDMGKPVKISNLARQMIEMSGLSVRDEGTPDGDIEIVEVGLRPGEKLYEELLIGGDTLPTPHPKILRARESSLSGRQLNAMLKAVQTAISASDPGKIRKLVTQYVSEYQPPSNGAG